MTKKHKVVEKRPGWFGERERHSRGRKAGVITQRRRKAEEEAMKNPNPMPTKKFLQKQAVKKSRRKTTQGEGMEQDALMDGLTAEMMEQERKIKKAEHKRKLEHMTELE